MNIYDAVLQKNETISAREYLERLARRQIDTRKVSFVYPCKEHPFGAFEVKLDVPRYRMGLKRTSRNG